MNYHHVDRLIQKANYVKISSKSKRINLEHTSLPVNVYLIIENIQKIVFIRMHFLLEYKD